MSAASEVSIIDRWAQKIAEWEESVLKLSTEKPTEVQKTERIQLTRAIFESRVPFETSLGNNQSLNSLKERHAQLIDFATKTFEVCELDKGCPICLGSWEEVAAVGVKTLFCGHMYCTACVREISTCSTCRGPAIELPSPKVMNCLILELFKRAQMDRLMQAYTRHPASDSEMSLGAARTRAFAFLTSLRPERGSRISQEVDSGKSFLEGVLTLAAVAAFCTALNFFHG